MALFNQKTLATGAIALLLSPALLGFSSIPPSSPAPRAGNSLLSLRFPSAPPGNGPARTASGGSRSGCFVDSNNGTMPMTVLMPLDNLGTTASENPELNIFIPTTKNVEGGEVTIFDPVANREVYIQQFDLSNKPADTPGIVKLKLTGANLEVGKTYEWSFTPFCKGVEGLPDYMQTFLQGRLQRKSLTPADSARLRQASTSLQRAEIYADAQVWNETLSLIREIGQTNPQEWVALLNSVGLEKIANAPYFGEAMAMGEETVGLEATESAPARPAMTTDSSTPIEGLW